MSEQIHKRRKRYKGTHPRSFDEKYKELNTEMYPETIEKLFLKGVHQQECIFLLWLMKY